MKLHIVRVLVGVELTVPDDTVVQNVGYVPSYLGEVLAQQIDVHVRRRHMGYYPALDYFRGRGDAVEAPLLSLVDEVAAFCSNLASHRLRSGLSRLFSSVGVEQEQATMYAMPRVRPGRAGAVQALAYHLRPNVVKLEMLLSSLDKGPGDGIEALSVQKVKRWAQQDFPDLEVRASSRLD